MEDRRSDSNNSHSAASYSGEHHCGVHSRFLASCEACGRARAAFLPYQCIGTPPAKTSRSFGFTDQMSPAMIHSLAEPMKDALVRRAIQTVERDILFSVIDDLLE